MYPLLLIGAHLRSLHAGGLVASHHEYPGYVMQKPGVHGQDCTPDTGDFPDACPTTGDTAFAKHGKIQCIHNFDCCNCGKLMCGPDCTDLVCNGDSSCYGVKDVELIGGDMGATINCNGDLACKWTEIRGTAINGILCTGDGACAYSKFDLVCLQEPEPCPLLCVGDDSCRSHVSDPRKKAVFNIVNSAGMKCAHDACIEGTFNLMHNLEGDVICGAEMACVKAEISITHIGILRCGGEHACDSAHVFIKDPVEGFSILCSGVSACENLNVEILVTDPEIMDFRGISCMSAKSCKNMHVSITKIGHEQLTIEELMCGAAEACRGAVFDISENVIFGECLCAGALTLACDNLLGVDQCIQGMNDLDCSLPNSCTGAVETLTNPGNDFDVVCGAAGSCADMQLTVFMDGKRRGVSRFRGISCMSAGACSGLTYNIYNVQGLSNNIDAGVISCDMPGACNNVTVNLVGATIEVSCVDPAACPECTVTTEGHCKQCAAPHDSCGMLFAPPKASTPVTP